VIERRARLPWVLWALALGLLAATLALTVRNASFSADPVFVTLAIAMILGYDTVGALVASRNPRKPIGWLMMVVPLGFVLGGFSSEYAKYAYLTSPGALPFRLAAGWLGNWATIVSVVPIPIVLTLFPDGRVPSRTWRFLPAATVACGVVAVTGEILNPGILDIAEGVVVENPTAVPSLEGLAHACLWIGGLGLLAMAVASVMALALRFRRSRDEERQQIRWLASVAALAGGAMVLTIVSGLGLKAGETRTLNDLSFFLFLALVGIGVPIAIGVAVLRYRLWDLDIVVKKTVIFVAVVVLLLAVAAVALLILGGIGVGLGVSLAEAEGATVAPIAVGVGALLGLMAAPTYRLARRIGDRIVYGGRASSYEVLTGFGQRLADAYASEDVLVRLANLLRGSTGASEAVVWLVLGDRLTPAATSPADAPRRQPTPIDQGPDALPSTDDVFEVRHQGELLGALGVTMPANDRLDGGRRRLVRDLAAQAGLVLRNARLVEELRASRRRLVTAQDAERRRLERDIHDGAQQQLVALAVKLRLADQLVARDPEKAREILGQLQAETNETLGDLRDLARGIYPPLLADEGLAAALQAQARKSPVPIDVVPDGIGRYPQEVESAVYFCVLEALGNVAKHARASQVTVRLEQADGTLTFEVRDDGRGFDPAVARGGTGLRGMTDRLDALGGTIEIEAAPGSGTTVRGSLPTA
jgi:signal transduction histidine kinase